jgi:hypothetical protein
VEGRILAGSALEAMARSKRDLAYRNTKSFSFGATQRIICCEQYGKAMRAINVIGGCVDA